MGSLASRRLTSGRKDRINIWKQLYEWAKTKGASISQYFINTRKRGHELPV